MIAWSASCPRCSHHELVRFLRWRRRAWTEDARGHVPLELHRVDHERRICAPANLAPCTACYERRPRRRSPRCRLPAPRPRARLIPAGRHAAAHRQGSPTGCLGSPPPQRHGRPLGNDRVLRERCRACRSRRCRSRPREAPRAVLEHAGASVEPFTHMFWCRSSRAAGAAGRMYEQTILSPGFTRSRARLHDSRPSCPPTTGSGWGVAGGDVVVGVAQPAAMILTRTSCAFGGRAAGQRSPSRRAVPGDAARVVMVLMSCESFLVLVDDQPRCSCRRACPGTWLTSSSV